MTKFRRSTIYVGVKVVRLAREGSASSSIAGCLNAHFLHLHILAFLRYVVQFISVRWLTRNTLKIKGSAISKNDSLQTKKTDALHKKREPKQLKNKRCKQKKNR